MKKISKIIPVVMAVLMAAVIGFGVGWASCLSYGIEKAEENLEACPVSAQPEVQKIELIECGKSLSAKNGQNLTLAEDILPEAPSIPGRLLTDEELDMVCGMVMGEGNGRDMYIAIAQCMKNAMELNGWTAAETIDKLYGTPLSEWSDLVEECVTGVFYEGLSVTDEPIMFYYAFDLCESPWHETRPHVMTILNTRFFK